jgi:hypothetical protein
MQKSWQVKNFSGSTPEIIIIGPSFFNIGSRFASLSCSIIFCIEKINLKQKKEFKNE